ncbi:hypothetical protein HPB50_017823 [Hyalomma asiaticum]|uniref:Uncharacterized protein n=1 Tax=Hyalomma asiaticum TaxID=266040 RepID=A0ACB7SXR6_HYAAI|nr:hypothetical protein HPB50_017823 [Hyalomma asiaticum]
MSGVASEVVQEASPSPCASHARSSELQQRPSAPEGRKVASPKHSATRPDPRRQRQRGRLVHGGHDDRVSESHWAIVVALVASLSIVIAFFVFVALAFATRSEEANRRLQYCGTPGCRAFAQLLAASVDTARKPCENFYRFVCGKWSSSRSVYQEHLSRFLEELATALRDARTLAHENTVSGRAASLYAGCESVLLGGNEDLEGFREVLSQAEIAWPSFESTPDVLATTFRIRKYFDIASLLKITKLTKNDSDSPNESKFLLEPGDLIKPKSGLHRVSYVNYKFYNLVVSAVAGPNSSYEPVISHENALRIGEDFRKAILPLQQRQVLTSPIANPENLSMYAPHFSVTRWRYFFAKHFNTSGRAIVVNVTDVEYLTVYSNLTSRWNESVMVWCTSWLAVAEMAPFMSKDIALHRFSTKTTDESAPRHCLELSERLLGAATFTAYVNKAFTKDAVEDMRASTVALLAPIQAKLAKSKWLVSPSIYEIINATQFFSVLVQARAYEKEELDSSLADNNTQSIAHKWVNAVRLRSEMVDKGYVFPSTMHLEDVHAEPTYTFFHSATGTVRLPLYAPMLPMYERGLTWSMRFGTMGVLFAQATFRSLLGRASRDNSSHPADHSHCLTGPSGNGSYNALYDRAVPVEMLEDFLDVAFPHPDRNRLDFEPQLAEMHIFFISMCYLLCSPEVGSSRFEQVCNEAVRYSRLFDKAFNCSFSTKTRPQDRCKYL